MALVSLALSKMVDQYTVQDYSVKWGRSCIQLWRISTQSEVENCGEKMKNSKAFSRQGGEWGDTSDRRGTVNGVDQRQRDDLVLSFIRVGPLQKKRSEVEVIR